VDEERDVAGIAALLADDCARTILEETATEARSAGELDELCEASRPTIYRKLERLETMDLVEVRTRPDAAGHHHKVYRASLDRVVVDLGEDGFELRVSRRDRMADRFTRFVEDMR